MAGKCSSTVEVRLLRFWEARNINHGGELLSVDMLLVDSKAMLMAAMVAASRVPTFCPNLTAGSLYAITGFEVGRCKPNFRLSDSSLLIRFIDGTSLNVLTEPISPIPDECFRFRSQSEFLGLANTSSQLPDLIGELTGVKSTVSDTPGEKEHLMATIKMDSDVSVTFSLFDAQAISFHKRLDSMRVDPRVIVATSINPKFIGGRLFLNATSGTHIYLDKESAAGETLFYKLASTNTGLPSAAPLLKGYAKIEHLKLSELNEFVVTAPSQVIDFICSGKITSINMEKGWCYIGCSKCTKKLHRTMSAFTCVECDNPHAVVSLRYRVEMTIADNTAEGVFVCFDGVLTKLHTLKASEAAHMLAVEGVNPEDSQIPPFIMAMEGTTFTFQVRVSAYNFTENHQTFTITRILNAHERAPLPKFIATGGNEKTGNDVPIGIPVNTKVETGGSSQQATQDTGETPDGEEPKRASAIAASKSVKKARLS